VKRMKRGNQRGATAMSDDDNPNRKHTTGTIDGHAFSLRVDGDAPAGLVADIESALADVKQGRESE